jgi:hypothetical protein
MKKILLVRFLPILAAVVQVHAQDPKPAPGVTYKNGVAYKKVLTTTGYILPHVDLVPIIISAHESGAVVPGGATGKRSVAIFRP